MDNKTWRQIRNFANTQRYVFRKKGTINEFTQLFDTKDELQWTEDECVVLQKAFTHYGKDWD